MLKLKDSNMSTDFKLPDFNLPDVKVPEFKVPEFNPPNLSGSVNTLKTAVDGINSTVNKALDPLFDNEIFAAVASICLVLFASLAAPALPTSVTNVLQTPYFRTGVLFSVLYV